MSRSIKVWSAASLILTATFAQALADSPKVINRDVLRQMVQLSVAFTQARISYTSPPYPVQYVNTSPFVITKQVRTGSGPIVNPNPNFSLTDSLIGIIRGAVLSRSLPAGNYNVLATNTSSFALTGPVSGTFLIPSNIVSVLPSKSTSGLVSVNTAAGLVNVTYTFRR